MKFEYLFIIFLLIMVPIMIIFTSYINNQVTATETEIDYDSRLLSSTYDAIKAYQLNTINNAKSDRPTSKVDEIEAAVTTFYNSLLVNFKYDGYGASVMEEYVPAVAFCLYDGYYVYSPIVNTLTGVDTTVVDVDEDYEDQTILNGLKPYVYYNCRYVGSSNGYSYDIIITYTLDNFITIDGTIDGDYYYKSGYLVDGITRSSTADGNGEYDYTYDGITFSPSDTERLKENIGGTEYYYTKIDGTKFYYSGSATSIDTLSGDEYIFYIDSSGSEKIQAKYKYQQTEFELYFKAIMENKDAYIYYRDAYEFTTWVRTYLSGLKVSDAVTFNSSSTEDPYTSSTGDTSYTYDFSSDDSYVFGPAITGANSKEILGNDACLQYSSSLFNAHRVKVIQNVIETNLKVAISAYSNYGDSSIKYIMPKISDTDWELITNNICVATFMQGMSIGSKVYNSYAVVANNLTKEYVDENDIYIMTEDYTYCKVNDATLLNTGTVSIRSTDVSNGGLSYKPGALKIDFERKLYNGIYYYPKAYKSGTTYVPYLGSYTSIIGSNSAKRIDSDMYRYVYNLDDTSGSKEQDLKTVYYTALGRERTQTYNVQNGVSNGADDENDENGEINGTIIRGNYYYLKNYKT